MSVTLRPITNPEKPERINSNFDEIKKQIDKNTLRRDGVPPGEANHMEVDLDMNGYSILNAATNLSDDNSLLTLKTGDERYLNDISEELNNKVNKTGDSMAGPLDMGNNFLRNLPEPVQDRDASTKAYVDQVEQLLRKYIDDTVSALHPPDYAAAQVGDEIGGGIYAGTITYADSREFHLVAAKAEGEAYDLEWGNYDIVTGATDPDDGAANQALILASFDNSGSMLTPEIFHHARDYTGGDNSDWYVPATNEVVVIQAALGGFGAAHPEFEDLSNSGDYAWTSTEQTESAAWTVRFSSGNVTWDWKYASRRRVRPIRRILV